MPRALLIFGAMLVAVATFVLAFVGAFWLQTRHDGEAGAAEERHASGGWTPRVGYLPSEAAEELGARCVDWEYQECVCASDTPEDAGRCSAALASLRDAAASEQDPGCRERIAVRPECASLAVASGSLSPATPEWDAWANLRAMQLGPSCSTLLQRTCTCGGDPEPCFSLQRDLLTSPGNDRVRRRLLERCRRVPDFDPRPCR